MVIITIIAVVSLTTLVILLSLNDESLISEITDIANTVETQITGEKCYMLSVSGGTIYINEKWLIQVFEQEGVEYCNILNTEKSIIKGYINGELIQTEYVKLESTSHKETLEKAQKNEAIIGQWESVSLPKYVKWY